ncbi:MAG: hypothetical protein ACRD8K_04920 [Nitrososphaeraceae archaeon]|jgi:hypothetical protein
MIVIIVPLDSGRPFETFFQFSPSADLLYIVELAFSIMCLYQLVLVEFLSTNKVCNPNDAP